MRANGNLLSESRGIASNNNLTRTWVNVLYSFHDFQFFFKPE
jgi:hypothetical protein